MNATTVYTPNLRAGPQTQFAYRQEPASLIRMSSSPPNDSPANENGPIVQMVRASEIGEFMYELRSIARNLLAGEREAHSVVPTMLVHTAFYRNTVRGNVWQDITWANRQHFFADMIQAMRRSLIDRARRNRAAKRPRLEFRGPEEMPVDFQRDLSQKPERVELLEEALETLEATRPELVRVVQFHFYVGLTITEIAEIQEVSEKTVDRDLKKARILLAEAMMKISQASPR
jgi:RNA polymerase sigma factor (TIGR02999 family)